MKPLMTIDESFEIELDQEQPLASVRKKLADNGVNSFHANSSSKKHCEQQPLIKDHAIFLIVYVD